MSREDLLCYFDFTQSFEQTSSICTNLWKHFVDFYIEKVGCKGFIRGTFMTQGSDNYNSLLIHLRQVSRRIWIYTEPKFWH